MRRINRRSEKGVLYAFGNQLPQSMIQYALMAERAFVTARHGIIRRLSLGSLLLAFQAWQQPEA